MPEIKNKLLPEAMRSINSASFTGSYQAIGSVLQFPSRLLLFVNNSGVNVTISWDGTNDAFVLLPGAGFAIDENANAVSTCVYETAAGTQFYAKGSASTGLVYLSSFYAT